MTPPTVLVHRDADELAAAVAARFIIRLTDVQAAQGSASVVLTGGTMGARTHAAVRESSARGSIDWRYLDVWWGDERFLASGDPERNETQARASLLDSVPLDPARVHAMPASDGPDGNDPEAAAQRYADALAAAARIEDHGAAPSFDLLMLGVGPDGHIASLFPDRPAVYETERTVVAVRGAPKPPPVRLTMTAPTISRAKDIWLIVSGEDKARAVALALSGAGPTQIPAAGASGRMRTLWLLDRAAASQVPSSLARAASP
jgi:6-phosphogluconolactonase